MVKAMTARWYAIGGLLLCMVCIVAVHALAYEPSWTPPSAAEISVVLDDLSFDEFVEVSYNNYMLRFPESITRFGIAEMLRVRNDRLDEYSQSYLNETRQIEVMILEALSNYNRSLLTPSQQLIYDAYEWFWSDLVAGHAFPIPITFFYYIQIPINLPDYFASFHPLRHVSDVEDYLCRLEQVDDQLDQLSQELQRHAESGILPYRDHITRLKQQIRQIIGTSEYKIAYYTALRDGLANMEDLAASERSSFLSEASQIIKQQINPAYRRFSLLLTELSPLAPDEAGLAHLPQGSEFYAYCLSHYTQTELSPEAWHEIGLSEVSQATERLQQLSLAAGFAQGMNPSEVFAAASDQGGRLEGEEILANYALLIEEARVKASAIIGQLPESDVAVIGHDQGGMYHDAPADGSRPAIFYAPTSGSQAACVMPLIAYHEVYPGHHVQRMLADELRVPLLFQSLLICGYQQGFVEGWGLYTEELTSELGWYDQDPNAHVAQGYYELLRCIAVVVNTGIHALGWSFDQAVAYYVDTMGMSESQADGYVYSAHLDLPGNYPGYKIGAMKFYSLRSLAEQALGDSFSLSEFHDAVLENGALPLSILEQVVRTYIAEKSGG